MNTTKTTAHYAALDWARTHHDIVVIDGRGTIVESFRVNHNAEGWTEISKRLSAYHPLPIAIEARNHAALDQLLAIQNLRVYCVHTCSSKRYRERHCPSGVKDDLRDAWTLADALRVDGHIWKPFVASSAAICELRILCHDEVTLIGQRTALVNALQQALLEYYAGALDIFSDWVNVSSWAFVATFPTPKALENAGRPRWEKFLHTNRLWRSATVDEKLSAFGKATLFRANDSTTAAKSLLALSLVRQLRLLDAQLRLYRKRINDVFHQHPDSDIFRSLPGAGEKLAPRLLAEIGDDRNRFSDPRGLQSYAGTAPVTIQSGQSIRRKLRRSCNRNLRTTVHLWADLSRNYCAWASIYYKTHRKNGQSHSCALRCLGQRWLKILWKMWQSKTPYDDALHLRNQTEHGSWTLSLREETHGNSK